MQLAHLAQKWIVYPAVIAVVLTIAGPALDAVHAAGSDTAPTYLDGLIAGEAQGREEGRALEIGQTLPAGEREAVEAAFKAGYAAGANDVFSGYDGGWKMAVPYVVTLAPATGPITYRIANRTPVEAGAVYSLCSDGGTICQSAQK